LPESAISGLWPQVEFEAGSEVERVSIRGGVDDDLMLILESGSPALPDMEIEAGISVVHMYAGDSAVIAGEDHLVMHVLGREFRVSAASFFQVNTGVAGMMVEHILATLPTSAAVLIDIYCGVGLFSAFLAPRCRRLIGIESSRAACEDFAVNLDEFDHVELYEDMAERALPALHIKPDAIVVDPPRAGLSRATLDAIVQAGPDMIIYVSCDPATLARDAGRLIKAGYRLKQVTPYDLFPQTYHIESISVFAV
jgi:23S rRNA (uracil1939-C5)-methyltransferase